MIENNPPEETENRIPTETEETDPIRWMNLFFVFGNGLEVVLNHVHGDGDAPDRQNSIGTGRTSRWPSETVVLNTSIDPYINSVKFNSSEVNLRNFPVTYSWNIDEDDELISSDQQETEIVLHYMY